MVRNTPGVGYIFEKYGEWRNKPPSLSNTIELKRIFLRCGPGVYFRIFFALKKSITMREYKERNSALPRPECWQNTESSVRQKTACLTVCKMPMKSDGRYVAVDQVIDKRPYFSEMYSKCHPVRLSLGGLFQKRMNTLPVAPTSHP